MKEMELDLSELVDEIVEKVKEEKDDKSDPIPSNSINIKTLSSDGIAALLKSVKINEYSKVAELTDIIKNRCITIGDVDEDTGDIIDNFIKFWNGYDEEQNISIEERIPIKICVDSYGGTLTSAFTIIDSIANSKTPIWTINIGKAYSAGLLILSVGHKRFSYKHSSFLFHEGSVGGVGGDANKFQNYADFYKKMRIEIKDILTEYTKLSEEEYDTHAKDDWWFMPKEALEKGFIDEIIGENKC